MTTDPTARGGRPDRCPVCSTRPGPGAGDSACPECGHLLWFVSEQVGPVTVVHLIDTRGAAIELLDLLDNAADGADLGHLLLNFDGIQQVSSAALGKLVKLMHQAAAFRGKLKLCGLHPDLLQVFRITRLDSIFEIYPDEGQALAAFAPA